MLKLEVIEYPILNYYLFDSDKIKQLRILRILEYGYSALL